MPYKEKETEKLYYSIGEVAEMFKVNTSLIRFWEKEFDIIKPQKNKKGDRSFTKEDIENFKLIFYLLREKGYTIEGARKRLKEDKSELQKKQQLLENLENIKKKLSILKETFIENPSSNLSDNLCSTSE